MVGHRFLTLTALAAALVLVTSTGTSWAHPGNGHRHTHGHAHAKAHGHKSHGQHADGPLSPVDGPDAMQPSTATSADASYGDASGQGHAYGRTHSDLASHPGKALGLYKHGETPDVTTHQPHTSRPPFSSGGGEPQTSPAGQPQSTQHDPTTNPGDLSGPPPSTGPPNQPPVHQPPIHQPPTVKDPAALAQVLLHSNPVRFTALPIVIISVMALGICGLIGLARHRASG